MRFRQQQKAFWQIDKGRIIVGVIRIATWISTACRVGCGFFPPRLFYTWHDFMDGFFTCTYRYPTTRLSGTRDFYADLAAIGEKGHHEKEIFCLDRFHEMGILIRFLLQTLSML
jgi:hypothetical protein